MDSNKQEKSVLERFLEKLDTNEKKLIKDYLQDKTLESLSKCFEDVIKEENNEVKTD